MQFKTLELSYINDALVEEGKTVTFNPPRDKEGKPLIRIGKNLEPVDDEAKAYKAEADAHFAALAAAKAAEAAKAAPTSEFDAAVSAKVNELLGPLVAALSNVQFTKAAPSKSPKAAAVNADPGEGAAPASDAMV